MVSSAPHNRSADKFNALVATKAELPDEKEIVQIVQTVDFDQSLAADFDVENNLDSTCDSLESGHTETIATTIKKLKVICSLETFTHLPMSDDEKHA